jgi:hypothetical protein
LNRNLSPPLFASTALGTKPARTRSAWVGSVAVCVAGIAGCSHPSTTATGCAGLTGVASIDCQADSKINDTQSPKITAFDLQIKKQPYSDMKLLNVKKAPVVEEKRP